MVSPPFELFVLPIKQGKKVAQVKVGWALKDENALRAAQDEVSRSKVGRSFDGRLFPESFTVEHAQIVPQALSNPSPKISQLALETSPESVRQTRFPSEQAVATV